MNVSLTPQLEQMVRAKVESGLYASASEVVREALRRMDKSTTQNGRERLNAALAVGIAELDAGLGVELSDDDWEQLMDEGDELARRGAPLDPDVLPHD